MSLQDAFAMAEEALSGLQRAGLSPESFGPLAAEIEQPQVRRQEPNWLDYLAPVVEAIASYENPRRERRNTWLAPALQGLTRGYGAVRQRGVREIAEANAAELDRARRVNSQRESEAAYNRRAFGSAVRAQTVDGALLTPDEIAERKTTAAAARARATAEASREGTNAANAAAGVPPVGAVRPKASPKPKAPKDASRSEQRRMMIASVVRGLAEHGITDRYSVKEYFQQKGVADTLTRLGITAQDVLNKVPE